MTCANLCQLGVFFVLLLLCENISTPLSTSSCGKLAMKISFCCPCMGRAWISYRNVILSVIFIAVSLLFDCLEDYMYLNVLQIMVVG